MKLAIKTCTLDMPYEEMLDFCVSQKIAAIEIGTGNWSGAPHCDLDLLVSDRTAREKWYDAMRAKGLGRAGNKGNRRIGSFVGIAAFEGIGGLLHSIQCSQFAVWLFALLAV